MRKVIFICKGNMHRSPTAEALYNLFKKDNSLAISYGTWVEKEGRQGVPLSAYPSFQRFIDELKSEYGVDISSHKSIQVTPEALEGADKIVVIAEEYSIPDWLRGYKYEHWDLPDKDGMTHEEIMEDIKGIKDKVEGLLSGR